MIFNHSTLSHVQSATAMVMLLPATCGAGLFALIALRIVAWSVSPSVAIVREHRAQSTPLPIPSDPGMNPLHVDAYRLRGTLPAAPGPEVMP